MSKKSWVQNILVALAAAATLAAAWGFLRWLGPLPEKPAEAEPSPVRISEIMSRNETLFNADGQLCDWVELVNTGAEPAELTGWGLSDREDEVKYTFPAGTRLQSGERLVIWCAKGLRGSRYASFSLAGEGGETLFLFDPEGRTADTVTLLPAGKDQSLIRNEAGELVLSDAPSPGFPNTAEGRLAYLRTIFDPTGTDVVLSEVMADNTGALRDENGELSDWIEMENRGAAPVEMGGWMLSDRREEPDRFVFPAGTVIPAGGELVVFLSGAESLAGELHAAFSLKEGESVYLFAPNGEEMDSLDTAALAAGMSRARIGDALEDSFWATPGAVNGRGGYAAVEAARTCASPVQIWEAAPVNTKIAAPPEKVPYDLVELRNVSAEPVSLSGWYLSDRYDGAGRWALPEKTLRSGEFLVIRCSGETERNSNRTPHASFSLSDGETVTLWQGETRMDALWLHDVPYNGALGRMAGENGFFYFEKPTPGAENAAGARTVAAPPRAETDPGVYEDTPELLVSLSGEGEIFYTTDGSVPTAESLRYSGPISVTETTVIRAAAITEGALISPAITLPFILNEGHTLPVVTLTGDPKDLEKLQQNYLDDIEVPVHLAMFGGAGEDFAIDGGVTMFGHRSLNLPKKSFKVHFRSRYGAPILESDVFGAGTLALDALVLRAGQDYGSAVFRDELFAELARDFSEDLVLQRYQFCVLYINGEYRGVFSLKEAYSEQMYASERGLPPESVTVSQSPVEPEDPFWEVLELCRSGALATPEGYERFCRMVDMDSLIDWLVMEGFSGNIDIQQNLRYIRSGAEDGRWRFAFYDLDWTFYNFDSVFSLVGRAGPALQPGTYLAPLAENADFRDRLCRRMAEALSGPLSEENVNAHIDALEELLRPEMDRERLLWFSSVPWTGEVNQLRTFRSKGWDRFMLGTLSRYLNLTPAEQEEYFTPWLPLYIVD